MRQNVSHRRPREQEVMQTSSNQRGSGIGWGTQSYNYTRRASLASNIPDIDWYMYMEHITP